MSRVGKSPVKIQQGVKVNIQGQLVKIEGPKGKLEWKLPVGIGAKVDAGSVLVSKSGNESKKTSALFGTARSLIQNMVTGCGTGYVRELDIVGVGFRAAVKGDLLNLTLGFSHPIDYKLPKGVTAKVDKNTHIILESADKALVGEVASKIRALRPPEPYQGKGIKYTNEHIIRKQGKAAGAAGGK